MFKKNIFRKAQTMLEYSVIIACVAAALGTIGVFFKAGLQKRIYSLAQELDSKPYAPRLTTSSSQGSATSSSNETYSQGVTSVNYSESSQKSGNETVLPDSQ